MCLLFTVFAFVVSFLHVAVLGSELDGYYRIRQLNTGRYLDAYDQAYYVPERPGYEAVTRPLQHAPVRDGIDKTQLWYIIGNDWGSYSLMQYTSGRFLDSCGTDMCKQKHSGWQWENVVMTLPANDSEYATSQRWYIQAINVSNRQFKNFNARIVQASSENFLNSHSSAGKDDQVYLDRDGVGDAVIWVLEHVNESPVAFLDGVFTIEQVSSRRKLDADDVNDLVRCYTSAPKFTESQQFVIRRVKGEVYTITHKSSGRVIGAEVFEGDENATVTPGLVSLGNNQQWMMVYVRYNTFVFQHVVTGRILGTRPYNSTTGLVFGALPTLAMYDGNLTDVLWTVERVGFAPMLKGIYKIRNLQSQRYLQGYDRDGTVTIAKALSPLSDDSWAIAFLAGDTYEIYGNASRRVLEAGPNDVHLGDYEHAPVVSSSSLVQSGTVPLVAAGNAKQQWYLVWAGGDTYYLSQATKASHRRLLDDVGGILHLASFSAQKSQLWTLQKVDHRCLTQRSRCPDLFQCGSVDDWCGHRIACVSQTTFSNGTCKGANSVTGEPYACHNSDHLCHCVAKRRCSACGTKEDDGCGGFIDCEVCPPSPMPAPFASAVAPVAKETSAETGFGPAPATKHPVASLAAPAPMPVAWEEAAPSTTFTTTCLIKCNARGWECGFQPDGCGNLLPCGVHAGACPAHPMNLSGASFSCSSNHTCACAKRTTCDEGSGCGFQPDGCGGVIACGGSGGSCDGDQHTCEKNKCVCVPTVCGNRCGDPVDDGCGNKIQCSCTMANEMCNRAAGVCERVAGPTPDPSVFASTTPNKHTEENYVGRHPFLGDTNASDTQNDKREPHIATSKANSTNESSTGKSPMQKEAAIAPSPATAPAVTSTTRFMPPYVSPPSLEVPPTTPPPLGLNPDLVGYYTYFYYIYYYYSFLGEKKKGLSDAEAAQTAQKMAPVYAYEQLKHTLGIPITSNEGSSPIPLPALPSAGVVLLAKVAAVLHGTQKKIDRTTMKTLLESRDGEPEESKFGDSISLPEVVDVSSVQGLRASGKHDFLRHQRSALRGALLDGNAE